MVQACGFRDAYDRFRGRGALVLGISPDTQASHVRFKQKYELPFTVLADPDRDAAAAYGVLVERERNGEMRQAIERSTFVIAPDGTVERALRGVRHEGHADEVLAALPDGS